MCSQGTVLHACLIENDQNISVVLALCSTCLFLLFHALPCRIYLELPTSDNACGLFLIDMSGLRRRKLQFKMARKSKNNEFRKHKVAFKVDDLTHSISASERNWMLITYDEDVVD